MKKIIIRIVLVVVILGIAYAGYKLFVANKSPATTNTATSTGGLQTTAGVGAGTSATPKIATTSAASASDTAIGEDFLNTLLSVQSISLDDKLFSSKAFTVLQDFNRPIPPDNNPGRPNPFAPIGSDGGGSAVQIATSNPSSVTSTSATLNGTLIVSDPTATRWFEYGMTSSFGMMTTPKAQTVPGAFTESITKLLPNTTYYVRADASVGGATVVGNTLTWKTAQVTR